MDCNAKMYIKRTTEKYKRVKMVKSKPKALQHFKVNPVLKIDETFYKQAESMCSRITNNEVSRLQRRTSNFALI